MRVGLVVSGGVDRSGTEVIPALLWLIERLAARHAVHVFVLHHHPAAIDYPFAGAMVHDLGTRRVPRGLRRQIQRRRLMARLRALPPMDVLHAWWGVPAGWVATTIPGGPPVVVTATSGEFVADDTLAYGFQRRWIDRRLIAGTMRRAAVVTVATQHMAGLAATLGVRTTVVPHGVPGDHLVFNLDRRGPPWRLIHIGHLNRVKDQSTLLHAMARVVGRIPDCHLHVVGGDTLQGACRQLAAALNLQNHVTFVGAVPHATVRALLRESHLHVMSSRHEAGGVAVLDAAAAGVPTVGTAVGYIRDWAPDAAVATPVGDVTALAEAITGVMTHPGHRTRLAATALARARGYTADDMAERFERLYHAVALEKRTPSDGMP